MTVRCKFQCVGVTKRVAWQRPGYYSYEADFQAVADTPQNKQFFEATPSGSLKIATYKEDVFQPGHDYFIDITSVPPVDA